MAFEMIEHKGNPVQAVFLGSKHLGLAVFKVLYSASDNVRWTIIHPEDTDDARSALEDWHNFARLTKVELLVSGSKFTTKKMLRDLRPSIGFVCGWYSIFDSESLSFVPNGLWGIHNSLLPKYRGGSPLVWSIINGDQTVGSTVFKISEGLDDGEILMQVQVENRPQDTISSILKKIEHRLLLSLADHWRSLITGNPLLNAQNESESTFCGQRIEADGVIDWSKDAGTVHNFIRAQSSPYPGAFTYFRDKKVIILSSDLGTSPFYGTPGQILKLNADSVLVSCGSNSAIELKHVRVDGIDCNPAEFLNSVKIRFTNNPQGG